MTDEMPIRARSRDLTTVTPAVQDRLLHLLPLRTASSGTAATAGGPSVQPPAAPFVAEGADGSPVVLLRVGRADHRRVTSGVVEVLRPAAVLAALTDQPGVVSAAGRAARERDIRFGVDPMFFRCGLDGFRSAASFQALAYAPPPGAGPWKALAPAQWRELARATIDEQAHRHNGLLLAATVAVRGPADPALGVARELLASSLDARDAWGSAALLAPVVLDLRGFMDLRSQLALVRGLEGCQPEALLVHLDGLHAGADPMRIAAALRLLRLVSTAVAPALLARGTRLRRLLAAFGLPGYEGGLGRLDTFQLDYFVGKGGGGSQPAKVEVQSLVTALPPQLARRALAAGVLPEEDDIGDVVRHDAMVLADDARRDADRPDAQRREALRADLVQGRHFEEELSRGGVDVHDYTGPLRTWSRAMDQAEAWGLHDEGRVRAQLEAA